MAGGQDSCLLRCQRAEGRGRFVSGMESGETARGLGREAACRDAGGRWICFESYWRPGRQVSCWFRFREWVSGRGLVSEWGGGWIGTEVSAAASWWAAGRRQSDGTTWRAAGGGRAGNLSVSLLEGGKRGGGGGYPDGMKGRPGEG